MLQKITRKNKNRAQERGKKIEKKEERNERKANTGFLERFNNKQE